MQPCKKQDSYFSLSTKAFLASVLLLGATLRPLPANAQSSTEQLAKADTTTTATVTLPVTIGWYKGQPAFYISTDASDPGPANGFGANLVPQLANATNPNAPSVDDIYSFTNFKQGNVLPSAPMPAGPGNTNKSYSPLWQVSTVTWNAGTKPHVLRSEEAIKTAAANGQVTVVKTNFVVNCPVVYTPQGGVLPNAVITIMNGK